MPRKRILIRSVNLSQAGFYNNYKAALSGVPREFYIEANSCCVCFEAESCQRLSPNSGLNFHGHSYHKVCYVMYFMLTRKHNAVTPPEFTGD